MGPEKMGWLKLFLNVNNAEGCREAMFFSYKKHLKPSNRTEDLKGSMPLHHVALYGALGSRYRRRRITITELDIWAELVPFLLMSEREAPEALAEYVVYQERPREARTFWLKVLINDSLRKIESFEESMKIMVAMTMKNNVTWCNLINSDVKEILTAKLECYYDKNGQGSGEKESDDFEKLSIDTLSFSEDMAKVKISGKWGFIDKTGKVIIKPKYDDASDFSEGLAKVNLGGKWGYIDKMSNIVILPIFDYIEHFSEERAIVEIGSKYGLIDKTGKYVIEPKFDFIWDPLEGISLVESGDKWGYIETKSGRVIVEQKYDGAGNFSEGLARVCIGCKRTDAFDFEGGKWGYIDKMGKMVIEMNYDDASDFSEGLARVNIRGKWGFIDMTSKIVIEAKYDDATDFKNGLARINIGRKKDKIGLWELGVWSNRGKWGYIDKKGDIIIEPRFDEVSFFEEGLARVCIEGKFGFIDKMGKMVIQPRFDYATDFCEGEALVEIQGKEYLLDTTGNIRFIED